MRISELSETTGVPVPTIKYYLREGLLHGGEKLTPRLARYDDTHRMRLGLLRVLREVGDVPVDRLGQLVAATTSTHSTVHEMLAAAADALAPAPPEPGPDRALRAAADGLIAQAGWTRVRPDSTDRDNLAGVLEAIRQFQTHPAGPSEAMPYVRVADEIARYEIWHLDGAQERLGLLEEMVVGQVVFGRLLAILRRLAEEHHSAVRFGAVTEPADAATAPPA